MKYILSFIFIIGLTISINAVEVGGHINQDTIWSPDNNPYIVTSFLYVDHGVTLTIQAGVDVQITSADKNNIFNFTWNGGNEPIAKMFIVNGRIIALGTALSPISFSKFGTNNNLRWGGMYLSSISEVSKFRFCQFKYSFFCDYIPNEWNLAAIEFENGSIDIRDCLFEANYIAIGSGSLNSDVLLYNCSFKSENDSYPAPFGNSAFITIGADENQEPEDYYKLNIAKCHFTGHADLKSMGTYVETLLLNNIYDDFTDYRQRSVIRLDPHGNTSVYGNDALNGKVELGCYSASLSDTVYCRRNRISKDTLGIGSSIITSYGYGTNIVSDNYLDGYVKFDVDTSESHNGYFTNNLMETMSNRAIELENEVLIHNGTMRIYNNVFVDIDPDSTHYHGMIQADNITSYFFQQPELFNNTFVNYETLMNDSDNAGLYTNNIMYNFKLYTSGSVSPDNPPLFTNNFLTIPIPIWGVYMNGGGNIGGDPHFIFSGHGNFQLSANSPCIDAGAVVQDQSEYDFHYYKRAVNGNGVGIGQVDMGAYEYNSVYIGGIQGYIYDSETRLPIDCVKISIQNKLPEFSDELGTFPYKTGAGIFTLKASRWDYDDVIVPGVVVNEGSDTIVSIPMHATIVGNEDHVQDPEVSFTLSNYPNPFNPSTTISYSLKDEGRVTLNIYNIKGQLVKNLQDGIVAKGNHSIVWNGIDNNGSSCASGVYFSRLTAGDKVVTRKMALIK